jgi:4-hydroxy-3-polyprenylbenzoate decarboxylase
MIDTKNPITIISVNKKTSQQELIKNLHSMVNHIKVLAIVDESSNFIDNAYMLVWRVVNNIDASRDIKLEPFISIDATNKNKLDNYTREWPKDTLCDKATLDNLQEKGLIDIDDEFINKFGLL